MTTLSELSYFLPSSFFCLWYDQSIDHSKVLKTDPDKVSVVKNWPAIKNVKDLRKVLWFKSYYRRFIQDYAKIVKPLNLHYLHQYAKWMATYNQRMLLILISWPLCRNILTFNLRLHFLKLKSKKCEVFKTEIKYLECIVSDGGIKTDPDKVSVVKNWPAIKNVKDLRKELIEPKGS
jgi:hypothetical protein